VSAYLTGNPHARRSSDPPPIFALWRKCEIGAHEPRGDQPRPAPDEDPVLVASIEPRRRRRGNTPILNVDPGVRVRE